MAGVKPYYTTDAMLRSIKNRISFPLSQNTFTYNDIVEMLNEELMLNAVPAIRELHEEFFVYKCPPTPLVNGISRYPIPSRAMGGSVRDINWSDTSGNYFKMSRIAPDDKAYFQQNVGSNQAIGKYYLEGNEIVITPQVQVGATGSLNFFIYLRPNHLVRDDRAATIQSFQNVFVISDNTQIVAGDTVSFIIGNQTPAPTITTLTAIASGSPTSTEFLIGATAAITASNINDAINNLGVEGVTSSISTSIVTVNYDDISTTFSAISNGITTDSVYMYIKFDNLSTTYTDPDTDITSALYEQNSLVDFLQTNPGHRTFIYDIKLRQIMPGNIGKFKQTDLQTYVNNSSGGQLQYAPIQVGDYICLANECIIPQIPPELHSKLAEMTANRILMAIGDKEGLAVSDSKLAQMDKQQAALIAQRVESSIPKVFNSGSLLRLGKKGRRRL